jgi:hypothetical protein
MARKKEQLPETKKASLALASKRFWFLPCLAKDLVEFASLLF